jgi:hypothetical protein
MMVAVLFHMLGTAICCCMCSPATERVLKPATQTSLASSTPPPVYVCVCTVCVRAQLVCVFAVCLSLPDAADSHVHVRQVLPTTECLTWSDLHWLPCPACMGCPEHVIFGNLLRSRL